MAGPFLRRRGGAYRLRVRVPSDLVGLLGRVEVGRALGTSDPRASRTQARCLHARLEAAWERIRMGMEEGTADQAWCIGLVDSALQNRRDEGGRIEGGGHACHTGGRVPAGGGGARIG